MFVQNSAHGQYDSFTFSSLHYFFFSLAFAFCLLFVVCNICVSFLCCFCNSSFVSMSSVVCSSFVSCSCYLTDDEQKFFRSNIIVTAVLILTDIHSIRRTCRLYNYGKIAYARAHTIMFSCAFRSIALNIVVSFDCVLVLNEAHVSRWMKQNEKKRIKWKRYRRSTTGTIFADFSSSFFSCKSLFFSQKWIKIRWRSVCKISFDWWLRGVEIICLAFIDLFLKINDFLSLQIESKIFVFKIYDFSSSYFLYFICWFGCWSQSFNYF